MSQNKISQQSFNLPDISLPDNFFSNFEEITKKYDNLELKLSNEISYNNIELKEKNDSYLNDMKKIKFHPPNPVEYAELIFDSAKAKKIYKSQSLKENDIFENEDDDKNIFKCFLKSELYRNKNNYDYNRNFEIDNNSINPNLKEILKPQAWDEDVQFIKENIFGNKSLNQLQRGIINAVLMDKDIFAFITKDAEKSICYHIPSIISNVTISVVILPSLLLINEQVKTMQEAGIKVLNLELYDDIKTLNIEKNFKNENIEENVKILYLTEKKLNINKDILNLLINLYNEGKIKRIIIDNANYLSQWDKNFRINYLGLKQIKENLKNVKILAFSSTPSLKIRDDVIQILNMKNVYYFKMSYNKPNLFLEVRNKKNIINPKEDIAKFIKENYDNKNGIIYCNSKNECDKLCEVLNKSFNINCNCYYEELTNDKKNEVETKWKKDEIRVLIVNCDFDIDINKSNIRFIIHYNIPNSIEKYYKNIERAGLDGEPSRCILYYDDLEYKTLKFLISKKLDSVQKVNELRELTKIIDFCEEELECRRVLLLLYFDEIFTEENCYHMCDICNKNIYCDNIDCTRECKIILNILNIHKNIYFSLKQMIDYLKGENREDLNKIYKINIEYFGQLSKYTSNEINKMIRYLIIKEYIDEYILNDKDSLFSALKINSFGEKIIENNDIIIKIKLFKKNNNIEQKNKTNLNIEYSTYHRNYDNNIYYRNKNSLRNEYKLENTNDYGLCEPTEYDDLFEKLKNIRRDILKKENEKRKNNSLDGSFIPLNLDDILSDSCLEELIRKLPLNKEEFFKENIMEMDKINLEKYSNEFFPAIIKFINIYNIDINKRKENRLNNLYSNNKNYYNEKDNKLYNDKNYLFIGFKRNKNNNSRIEPINNKLSDTNVFNKLVRKNKKNKKIKFL